MTITVQSEVNDLMYWGSRAMVGGRNSFMRSVALGEMSNSLSNIRWCYGA